MNPLPALSVIVVLFLSLYQVQAVKHSLFKTCDQAGFCHRNKHYASQITQTKSTYYTISSGSLMFGDSVIQGVIEKKLNETHLVNLPFELHILSNDNVRLRIDEDRSSFHWENPTLLKKERFGDAWRYAFNGTPTLQTENKYEIVELLNNEGFEVRYGDNHKYSIEVLSSPFKVTAKYQGEPQMVLNDRLFLNIEHLRSRSSEQEQETSFLPEESDYDAFKDSFHDSREDSLPFGPESIALDVSFLGFKHVYGIPEHADSLSLKDTSESGDPYRLYNVDIFEYETDSRLAMYGAIPFMIGHKRGLNAGLFWVNGADTFIDVNKHNNDTLTHWVSENGVLDLVILMGETPAQVTKNYAALTGFSQLPQLFSLGYHQCRWNYNDEDDVLTVSRTMDEYEIPYDVIWLDVEYTVGKKYFTWNPSTFPDPERMLGKLEETGRNLVAIIDPHLKTGYEVTDELVSKNLALKDNKGQDFKGHCWPGESHWIDTFNPQSQPFWDAHFSNNSSFAPGNITNLHIWNDMNEPSVFSGPETTTPKDSIVFNGTEIRSKHNIYGLTYHEATYKSLRSRYQTRRPFILTRSYFAGSQRTSAMWTGDNMSSWAYLRVSLPMLLTQQVVNFPFAGADVGGFFGDPSKELLTRWYQAGIWYPFFRAHAHIDSRRREPWIAGDPYTSVMRDAVRLRYRLLPLFYTKFYESSRFGDVVLQPMVYAHPDSEKVFDIDDQFYLGGLLVKPVTEESAASVSIYIPDSESIYYDFDDHSVVKGEGYHRIETPLEKIPVLVRGGSITPSKDRYRRSSKLMKFDPYTLLIALNSTRKAAGNLYLDDGETFNYENGEFLFVQFEYDNGVIQGEVLGGVGGFEGSTSVEKIQIVSDVVLEEVNKAVVEQDEEKWAVEVSQDKNLITVKNPKVDLSKAWKVTLE